MPSKYFVIRVWWAIADVKVYYTLAVTLIMYGHTHMCMLPHLKGLSVQLRQQRCCNTPRYAVSPFVIKGWQRLVELPTAAASIMTSHIFTFDQVVAFCV
jgi:hypothetical protein